MNRMIMMYDFECEEVDIAINELSNDSKENNVVAEPPKENTGGLKYKRQLDIYVTVTLPKDKTEVDAHALVDSGCTASCIDHKFVEDNKIPTKKFPQAIPVFNADGTGSAA